MDAIDQILREKPLPETKTPQLPKGYDISLDHVSFSYEDAAGKALDDVSLDVPEGTITALVGESGGGKSTVANLIARFWDVDEGVIRVGGVDVREMDYKYWMEQVSIVFQDTNLFKMSIMENVAVFNPDASREDVLQALHLAQCDDILENAPVVLLDEATAFADAENEYLIQKALDELLRGKTVIMIAHRLSTIIHADQICVLERGKIVEKGTHRELMDLHGVYAGMYEEYQSSISWRIGEEQYA